MTLPTYQSVTNVDYLSSVTSVVVPVPASVAVGDLLVALITCGGGTGAASLSGWTDVPGVGLLVGSGSGTKSRAQYRIADGTEGADETWTVGSALAHGSMMRITGAHATVPFPVNGTNIEDSGVPTTFVIPTFTTLVNDCLLIAGGGCNSTTVTYNAGPATQGGTWTEIVDSGQAGGAGKCAYMGYQPVAFAAGATGTMTLTISSGRAGNAWMVAVAPAVGSAGGLLAGGRRLAGGGVLQGRLAG